MALTREHDLHKRRASRNFGVAAVLLAFVALVFGLTIAKMQRGESMEAYDHSARIGLVPDEDAPAAAAPEAGQ